MGALNFDPFKSVLRRTEDPIDPGSGEKLSSFSDFSRGRGTNFTGSNQDGLAGQKIGQEIEKQKKISLFVPESSFQNRGGTPAKFANLLKCADCPDEWIDGFARLDPDRPPGDFPGPAWRNLIHDGEAFLAGNWARQAHALGWDTLSVWGVHRVKPHARFDAAGLVAMIGGCRIIGMTDSTATYLRASGSRNRVTRFPTHPEAILMWEFAS